MFDFWIINNLRQDFFGKNKIRSPQMKSHETQSFYNGVYKVLVADIAISFDNVIVVFVVTISSTSRILE